MFTIDRYLQIAALVGPLLADLDPVPYHPTPGTLPDAANAVYIVIGPTGAVIYVGSVCRQTRRALRARIAEHLHQRPDTGEWAQIWVLRIQDQAGAATVRWAEARVGRHLCPTSNQRLPRFPRHRSHYA